jgi:hypothetical protein
MKAEEFLTDNHYILVTPYRHTHSQTCVINSLDMLTVTHLVKRLRNVYGTRRFIKIRVYHCDMQKKTPSSEMLGRVLF